MIRTPEVPTKPGPLVWMDSGAFSAFTLGEQQDLRSYCAWLERNEQYIDHYAVLDVIGSAEGTWDNQRRMEDLGRKPVPCYHYGEDPSWLVKYLEAGYEYIALGGMVPISTPQLRLWLDELWDNYLTDASGRPVVKVHGFGLTTFDLMERYPWFSVDSSSWLQSGAFGMILYISNAGEVTRVNVSDRSAKASEKGQHYLTETPATQAEIRRRCEELGFPMDELISNYRLRHELNATAYSVFSQWHGGRPWLNPERSLFSVGPERPLEASAKAWPWKSMTLFLAGEVDMEVEHRLHKHNLNRMFTYHLLKHRPTPQWKAIMALREGKPFPPFAPPKRKTAPVKSPTP